MIQLASDESVPDRPFTATAWTSTDEAVLDRMWDRLRAHARTCEAGRVARPAAKRTANDRTDRLHDPDGSVHTIVFPDLRLALRSDDLFAVGDAETERAWGDDRRHVDAVRRSPDHYHSIRLHHARASSGLLGTGPIRIARTRYLDYAADRPWRAVRERGIGT